MIVEYGGAYQAYMDKKTLMCVMQPTCHPSLNNSCVKHSRDHLFPHAGEGSRVQAYEGCQA
jgi:hypothetical protein